MTSSLLRIVNCGIINLSSDCIISDRLFGYFSLTVTLCDGNKKESYPIFLSEINMNAIVLWKYKIKYRLIQQISVFLFDVS